MVATRPTPVPAPVSRARSPSLPYGPRRHVLEAISRPSRSVRIVPLSVPFFLPFVFFPVTSGGPALFLIFSVYLSFTLFFFPFFAFSDDSVMTRPARRPSFQTITSPALPSLVARTEPRAVLVRPLLV